MISGVGCSPLAVFCLGSALTQTRIVKPNDRLSCRFDFPPLRVSA